MAKNANIYVRVKQETKDQATEVFSTLGISVTEAVNMFLHKAILVGGLPFDVRIPTPNAETLKAMQEIEDMENGKIQAKSYSSFSELLKEVEADV